MGLGLILFYLPLYLLLTVFALSKVKKNKINGSTFEVRKHKKRYVIIGFIISTMLTWFLMWCVPGDSGGGVVGIVFQIALTLIAPTVFLIILNIINSILGNNRWGRYKSYISGVCYSIVAMPWLSLFAVSNYYNIVNFPAYYELCSKSKIVFKKSIEPANSVFLTPDKFTHAQKGYQSSTRDIGEWLVLASSLKYVERQAADSGDFEFEQIKKIDENAADTNGDKKYIVTPVEKVSAEYSITPSIVELPELKLNGIGGAKIEVRRIIDEELIAYAEYYWDNKSFKSCPNEARDTYFIIRFIMTSLNVNDDSRYETMKTDG